MLQYVDVGRRHLDRYGACVGPEPLEQVRELARDLRGSRVLHVNATPYGGGVSELLRSVVPLLRDVGVHTDWCVISGDEDFFRITKAMHNALQGQRLPLSRSDRQSYLRTAQSNADQLDQRYDVCVVHDPQPVALASLQPSASERWIWRCHIDTSNPAPEHWRFLAPFLDAYDGLVFTMGAFVPDEFHDHQRFFITPPAIDPLSPKNLDTGDEFAHDLLGWFGIDRDERIITQVSRFDPWKDPLGVLEAYRLARSELPDLQLVFVGNMVLDDPQGWDVYRTVHAAAAGDPGVHIYTNLNGIGDIEVNAFQRRSDLIVQKSTREGFGLVVSEAMWKSTPVVAGRAGGIPLQMADGAGGLLADDVPSCASAIVELLSHPDRARDVARRGHERVRDHFLVPRLLLDELAMLDCVLNDRPSELVHDPQCGMVLASGAPRIEASVGHAVRAFCSEHCRDAFQARHRAAS